jgi:hypothetical protein
METLEKYLNLSKEICPSNTFIPPPQPSTNNTNITDETTSTIDNNPSSTINMDISISTNETNSITPPVINKRLSRPSFNSFSKIIRRTFIEPFSSVKRASLKLQRQHQNTDTSDTSMINENERIRRASSPLLNRRTNNLTIIVTNFQPKRPKTSDNMIKNYIDSCMNEYRPEKNSKQLNEISSAHENENNSINNNYSDRNHDLSSYQQSNAYHRYYPTINTNRYQQNTPLTSNINETSGRKLPAVPLNSTNRINPLTKRVQKNSDIDDNDDLLPMEDGQFSSNINYVQQTQRKSNQLTQVRLVAFFSIFSRFEFFISEQ